MDIGSTLHNPEIEYHPLYTPVDGLRVIISDYAPVKSYYVDTVRNLMIISEDNMRKLIWALNIDNFDVALEEVCHFIKERLFAKIDRKFSYDIDDIPRLMRK
jgi:hypothetical protein